MPQAKRIYTVSDRDGRAIALVNATNPLQALHFVVRGQFSSKVASPAQLIALTKQGMEVQELVTEETAEVSA